MGWLCVLAIPAVFLFSCEFEGSAEGETFTWFDVYDRKLNVALKLNVDGEPVHIVQPLICKRDWAFSTAEWAYLRRTWVGGDFSHKLGNGSRILVSFSRVDPFHPASKRELCDIETSARLRWGDQRLPRIGWMGESRAGTIIESYQLRLFQTGNAGTAGGHIDVSSIELTIEPDGWAGILPLSSDNDPASWFNNDQAKSLSRQEYANLFVGYRVWRIPKKTWSEFPALAGGIASRNADTLIALVLDQESEGTISVSNIVQYHSPDGRQRAPEIMQDLELLPLLPSPDRSILLSDTNTFGFEVSFLPDMSRIPADFNLILFYQRVAGVSAQDFASAGSLLFYDIVLGDENYRWYLGPTGRSTWEDPIFYEPQSESILVLQVIPLMPT